MRYLIAVFLFALTTNLYSNAPNKVVDKEIDCLATNMYHESRGEGTRGIIAVANVTMNRLKSSKYPETVCSVVNQKVKSTCQFSWVCEQNIKIRNYVKYLEIRRLAERVYNGKVKDITKGATHFHNSNVFPSWASQLVHTTRIGNHLFYKT